MYIRSRKCARKYSERYDHGPEILIGKIDPGFIIQNLSRASLSDSVVPGTKWRGACPEPFDALKITSTWETQDPDVLCRNPVIEGADTKSELVWATIECTYVLPDVKVHPIPFGAM